MSDKKTSGADAEAFDMDLEPAPKAAVIDAEEDEEAARKREAALASTFDPERAHFGKSDEDLVAERDADGRALVDAAIVIGVAAAAIQAREDDTIDPETDAAEAFDGADE